MPLKLGAFGRKTSRNAPTPPLTILLIADSARATRDEGIFGFKNLLHHRY
jgi:hypothetical protein